MGPALVFSSDRSLRLTSPIGVQAGHLWQHKQFNHFSSLKLSSCCGGILAGDDCKDQWLLCVRMRQAHTTVAGWKVPSFALLHISKNMQSGHINSMRQVVGTRSPDMERAGRLCQQD